MIWPVVKKSLPFIVSDVDVIIPLLSQFKPSVRTEEELRAQKRAKTNGYSKITFYVDPAF